MTDIARATTAPTIDTRLKIAALWTNIIVAVVYTLTILGSCIGEVWIYYWLGSLIEVLLLMLIARYAWKMP